MSNNQNQSDSLQNNQDDVTAKKEHILREKEHFQNAIEEHKVKKMLEYKGKSAQKAQLNKTLYQLRKLPLKARESLATFMRDEREHGSTYLAYEMFRYLTGSPDPSFKSPYLLNFNDFGQLEVYPENVPYCTAIEDKIVAKSFFKDLSKTAFLLAFEIKEEEVKAYLGRLTAPDTTVEKLARSIQRHKFNMQEITTKKVPHIIHLCTHGDYRKAFKQYKAAEARRQKGSE